MLRVYDPLSHARDSYCNAKTNGKAVKRRKRLNEMRRLVRSAEARCCCCWLLLLEMRCDHASRVAGSLALDGCERRRRAVDGVLLCTEGSCERRGDRCMGARRGGRGCRGSGSGAARLSLHGRRNALTLGRRHRGSGRRSSRGCACSGGRSGGSRARGAGRQRTQGSLLRGAAWRRCQLRDAAHSVLCRCLFRRILRRLALCCRCRSNRSRRSRGSGCRCARSLWRPFALVRIVAHA